MKDSQSRQKGSSIKLFVSISRIPLSVDRIHARTYKELVISTGFIGCCAIGWKLETLARTANGVNLPVSGAWKDIMLAEAAASFAHCLAASSSRSGTNTTMSSSRRQTTPPFGSIDRSDAENFLMQWSRAWFPNSVLSSSFRSGSRMIKLPDFVLKIS